MTGHVRKGSDIDLHVFCDNPALVTDLLEQEGLQYELERKQVVKHGESRVFTHIHVYDRFNFELTVYPEDKAHYVFRSSITGKAIERASIGELEDFLAQEYPDLQLDGEAVGTAYALRSDGAAGPAVFLAGVAVVEAARRRGVAAAMSAWLLERGFADGARLAHLHPETDAAARVYARLGFIEAGALDIYVDL